MNSPVSLQFIKACSDLLSWNSWDYSHPCWVCGTLLRFPSVSSELQAEAEGGSRVVQVIHHSQFIGKTWWSYEEKKQLILWDCMICTKNIFLYQHLLFMRATWTEWSPQRADTSSQHLLELQISLLQSLLNSKCHFNTETPDRDLYK